MGLAQFLPDFGTVDDSAEAQVAISDVALEEQRLDAFEKGYTAGWDDAIKAQADDKSRITQDFARNLGDLSFTYHEAYSHLTKALGPLLSQIVNKVLPKLAQATLGAHIVDQLTEMGLSEAEQTVEIVVAPDSAEALNAILTENAAMPVRIVEEPTLAEGQVYMRFAASERELNMKDVLEGIQDAVHAFLHQTQDGQSHGSL